MSIKNLLNPNSLDNKSLNLYSNGLNVNSLISNFIDIKNVEPPLIITASSDAMAPVFLRMDADSGDPDLRKFGFYYSNSTKNFWIALFNDSGAVINNLMCFEVIGGKPIVIPARGLSLNNNGGLFNIPSNSGTDSFYEEFTSSGNGWIGPYAMTVMKEYNIVKIGNNVTLSLGTVSGASVAPSVIAIIPNLPARFTPLSNHLFSIVALDNSVQVTGTLLINTSGTVVIGNGITSGNFSNTGNAGCVNCTVSYSLI